MFCRAMFLSDLHLGSKACQADMLLLFLKGVRCNRIYLVGDIIDIWAIKRRYFCWPDSYSDVISALLQKKREGVEIFFITGNHDGLLRKFGTFPESMTHHGANGKKYLVMHGDQFDKIIASRTGHIWTWLGNHGYSMLLRGNVWVNKVRKFFGLGYWSLADAVKRNLKVSLSFISNFKEEAVTCAKNGGFDGVICGHIHSPSVSEHDGVTYMNCGDWVDSCTAIVETFGGEFKLLRYEDVSG